MKKTRIITETAIMIALLVVIQAVTKSLGQFVTGSGVNLILAVSTLTAGLTSGLIVAAVSPFFAFLLGIGTPIFPLVPGIAVGNMVYVVLLHFLAGAALRKDSGSKLPLAGAGVIVSAFGKFLTLFLLMTKVLIPLAGLPEKQVAVLSATFSWPQLVTALIGGFLALAIAPSLNKALKR